jgi:hypothetical protein
MPQKHSKDFIETVNSKNFSEQKINVLTLSSANPLSFGVPIANGKGEVNKKSLP